MVSAQRAFKQYLRCSDTCRNVTIPIITKQDLFLVINITMHLDTCEAHILGRNLRNTVLKCLSFHINSGILKMAHLAKCINAFHLSLCLVLEFTADNLSADVSFCFLFSGRLCQITLFLCNYNMRVSLVCECMCLA